MSETLREFKQRVMEALDVETQLELQAFKLRQEMHAEFKEAPPLQSWVDSAGSCRFPYCSCASFVGLCPEKLNARTWTRNR